MFLNQVIKFIFRCLLFLAAVILYFKDRQQLDFSNIRQGSWFLAVLWVVLAVEMLFRIVQNRKIAMGARKHFAGSYRPAAESDNTPVRELVRLQKKGALLSALAWIAGNAVLFAVFARLGLFAPEGMVLLLLAYTVCDMICILFFCPFQVFFMKNRCCTVCRIYNWDCLMICTPLLPFPNPYSVSLVLLSLAVLIRWELAYSRRPHYFFEQTNENLGCQLCTDRLCTLRRPWPAVGDSMPQKRKVRTAQPPPDLSPEQ